MILKILDFLNLLDSSKERLSLTNIALIALIVKVIVSPTTDWPSIVSLILGFTNYAHKRVVGTGSQVVDEPK